MSLIRLRRRFDRSLSVRAAGRLLPLALLAALCLAGLFGGRSFAQVVSGPDLPEVSQPRENNASGQQERDAEIALPNITSEPAARRDDSQPGDNTAGSNTPNDGPSADNLKLPQDRLQNARELLALYGIDESHWRQFLDGTPPNEGEQEMLLKLLYRLPRFLLEDIERWEQRDWSPGELIADPQQARGEIFVLKGRATSVKRHELQPELETLYEFDHYYEVHLALADSPAQAVVFTRKIPASWLTGEATSNKALNERVRVSGLFLKAGLKTTPANETDPASDDQVAAQSDKPAEAPQLVFAAQRVAWFPEEVDPELGVTADHVLLASLGMDVGLLSQVRQRTKVGYADREAFYQMLAAARRAPAKVLREAAPVEPQLAPLFVTPDESVGMLTSFVGTARRITKIECEGDIRRRFGIAHYYQIDVIVPLENAKIRLGKKEDHNPEQPGPVFTNSFPFTYCVTSLPKGLEPAQDLNQQVRIDAFFFKLWSYRTVYMEQFDEERRQLGPMLVGREPRLVNPVLPDQRILSAALAVLFVVTLGGIWVSLWRTGRADQEFERKALQPRVGADGEGNLNQMGIETTTEPDFRNWGERHTSQESEQPAATSNEAPNAEDSSTEDATQNEATDNGDATDELHEQSDTAPHNAQENEEASRER